MLVTKVILSAAVVGGVSVLSNRYPALGGYIAVLPIVTFLSLVALITDQHSSSQVSTFLMGALVGVALTSLTLILMLVLVRSGLSVMNVVLLGAAAWTVLAFAMTRMNDWLL